MAEDYDQAVRAWGYCLPEACIDSLVKHAQFDLKDTNVNVLDLGCGAGKYKSSFYRFCLFVLFVTEATHLSVKTGLNEEAMPIPYANHCCNSGMIRGASPRCFPYTITWTPEEESTCNAGHGIGTWSAERHWEADPTTAGRGHF